ncbi:MAG: hypothetical protein HWD58_13980 [Bacteroidota bacterium]|nr:MAG: hypothetical protein HWD58_13980 [Bacteroidota bacterium]
MKIKEHKVFYYDFKNAVELNQIIFRGGFQAIRCKSSTALVKHHAVCGLYTAILAAASFLNGR